MDDCEKLIDVEEAMELLRIIKIVAISMILEGKAVGPAWRIQNNYDYPFIAKRDSLSQTVRLESKFSI